MQAMVQRSKSENWPCEFVKVISNKPQAAGLAWAAQRQIDTAVIAHQDYGTREAFDECLAQTIDEAKPDYVLLAGFMRILTTAFVKHYEGRLINIHPSLLPAFAGLKTHEQALAAGVGWHGCTVHFVTDQLDLGPIIAQAALPVRRGQSASDLADRVLAMEHQLYPQVLKWLCEGRVSLKHGKAQIEGVPYPHLWQAP